MINKIQKIFATKIGDFTISTIYDPEGFVTGGKDGLYETMIFLGGEDTAGYGSVLDYQVRVRSFDEALKLHQELIKEVYETPAKFLAMDEY